MAVVAVALALLVPGLAATGSGRTLPAADALAVTGLAATLALASRPLVGRRAPWVGVVMVAVAAWLTRQTAVPGLRGWIAVVAGLGVAHAAGRSGPSTGRRGSGRGATDWLVVAGLVVLSAGVVGWTGANTRARWFGAMIGHGPRSRPAVALTFDDGPNDSATLALARILDAHGAKGTFFSVGRAVEQRPGISRALLEGGHLLANHSFAHGARDWLDPRYPELMRADRVFADRLGVCPAFFRPPHHQRTPFMAFYAHRQGIRLIGDDAETADWRISDPVRVADDILARVRPGSIVDLHDGLDGDPAADRRVVVEALPRILDGLRLRHLTPVRLDDLLGLPGYRRDCGRRGTLP